MVGMSASHAHADGGAFEDSQFSLEELQIKQQKSQDKTPNGGTTLGSKVNTNNLFDKSSSRDAVSSTT